MSVGYDLEGITNPRMTRFLDVMGDASEQVAQISDCLRRQFPQFADIEIPARIVNSVTLSTMHGCPPEKIERIARYLLDERGLHTVVKLNPTLLGRDEVRDIVNRQLGFTEIDIPDAVFDHDLQYGAAIDLIAALKRAGAARGLTFGVKLSNTLATRNHTGRLPGDEMYMSGRPLYPVTMNLYDRLLRAFNGDLHVSYSAGVDALNVAAVLSCGALPVTGCTDLLKPGGYRRLTNWLEHIGTAMSNAGDTNLAGFSRDRLTNVAREASEALSNLRYKKQAFPHGLPKVASGLGQWDCVVAPCVEACAVEQDVPEYAWLIAQGDYDRALEVILARNPLPGVTGYVCTRLCETRCTRNDYEETVAIRSLKRIAEERGHAGYVSKRKAATGRRVAIVGSGPSGLAAAAFLALNGVQATIFEAKDIAGGMLRVVPSFRLPSEIIERDIDRIVALGVTIALNTKISAPPEELLASGFDAVYLAAGFQRDAPLNVPGIDGPGILPALDLLDRARRGQAVPIGKHPVVIGGGDTAMDAARTAQRLIGAPVTILYRRTRTQMPAAPEEVEGALEEGNRLEPLVAPIEILRDGGHIVGVRCMRNELGEPGSDGRRLPRAILGSAFVVPCDTVIVAVGQLPELAFLDGSRVTRHAKGGVIVDSATRCAGLDRVYAGGDMVIEPGSIIAACADGRRAAESICERLGVEFAPPSSRPSRLSAEDIIDVKAVRARKIDQIKRHLTPVVERVRFALVESTLTEAEARREARRCVQCTAFCDKCVEVCPNRSNYTFTMRPVRWTLPVVGADGGRLVVTGSEDFIIVQDRQIVHVDDFCNECDNCQTFCVHHGKPYTDKPRLFLDAGLFAAEDCNAYHIDGNSIRRREGGRESRLSIGDDTLTFEDTTVKVTLSRDWHVVEMVAKGPFAGTCSLRPAAEMAVLYEGIGSALPFLRIR
jgi:putative selenate reductase